MDVFAPVVEKRTGSNVNYLGLSLIWRRMVGWTKKILVVTPKFLGYFLSNCLATHQRDHHESYTMLTLCRKVLSGLQGCVFWDIF